MAMARNALQYTDEHSQRTTVQWPSREGYGHDLVRRGECMGFGRFDTVCTMPYGQIQRRAATSRPNPRENTLFERTCVTRLYKKRETAMPSRHRLRLLAPHLLGR